MLDEVIKSKKLDLESGVKNSALEENERDLLTLMLESGEEGNGILSNKELKVLYAYVVVSYYTYFALKI